MRVFLIRHTPTVTPKGTVYGSSDVNISEPFTPLFDDIAQIINKATSTSAREHVYFASPLIRCKLMAEYMSKNHFSPANGVQYDSRLKEIHFGQWELKRWKDIPQTEIDEWLSDFAVKSAPEGESFAEVMSRSVAFWQDSVMPLCDETRDVIPAEVSDNKSKPVDSKEPVVHIYSHGGVLRAILCHILGMEMKDSFKLIIRHGSVTELEIHSDSRKNRLINLSKGGVEDSF
ncbi:MAG: histidine phosphatase family protein [Balneolales bacterium]|nr:histidine phosphatase family protein [Balneolales bacterium]